MSAPPMLGPEEVERYARHLVLREVGGAGQRRLRAARVLIVGAGGLGSPVALYLAAAGVGTLRIADDDAVSLSNLQRQVLHGTPDLGRSKVESARDALGRVNPHVAVEAIGERFEAASADRLLDGVDLVVEGTDGFAARALVAEACEAARVPLVTGAVGRFEGSVTVFKPYEAGADGRPHPRFADLFPAPPPPGAVPSCAEAGVIGALTGVIGSAQAMEALKLLLGIGEPLVGRLLVHDALAADWRTIRYRRRDRAPPDRAAPR